MDQRGHGDSDWSVNGYSLDGYVSNLEGFINALGLQQIVLVGLSMGGRNAYVYTAMHVEKVDKLIIVDIGAEPGRATIERPPELAMEPESFADEHEVIEHIRAGNPNQDEEYWGFQAYYSTMRREDGRLIWKWDPALRPPSSSIPVPRPPPWDYLKRIACPTLIVRGENSEVLDSDVAERMRDAIPNSKLIEIEGAGHTVNVDKPHEFEQAFRQFLGLSVGC